MRFLVILIVLLFLFIPMIYADSMAAVLDEFQWNGWWCLHQDGHPWAPTPYDSSYSQQDAISWCAANGYTF